MMAIGSSILVYLLTFLHLNDFCTLLLQCACGIVIYFLGSWMLRIDSFFWLQEKCRNILKI